MTYFARHRWLTVSVVLLAIVAVALSLFRWDWLIPIVDKQASAALGRQVTITHLHVQLGRNTRIEADGLTIANPADWPGGGNFATADRLGIDILPLDYIQHRQITLPVIDLQSPKVDAQQLPDGRANWTFDFGSSNSPSTAPAPKLGTLRIADGHAHVVDPKLRADFNIALETQDSKDGTGQIAANAKGTYANQPITAQFVGGALLSLRDTATPYPVDLKVANGPTRITLAGTVADPLAFAGADLKLDLAGPDMALLLPLTGVAIPKTPPYRITGKLDYGDGVVKFQGFTGKVGSSDLEGSLSVDTKPKRPELVADLQSKLVDLNDLGGFIGADPGDASKGTKAPSTNKSGKVLPSDPISLPKLNVADVHLHYKADHIQGRRQPLDNMRANLDIVDGDITLKPLSFGLGRGQISADISLAKAPGDALHTKAAIDFQRIEVDKLLSSAGIGRGAGAIGGRAVIDGTGHSMAEILGRGNGELKLYMGSGGDLSALLVDISGLEFGNAVLSALGVPNRAQIQCLITDFVLQNGVANARTVVLDTTEARIGVKGDINLRTEDLGLLIDTKAKHFSVGSLQTPIEIKGTFGAPGIAPQVGPLAAKAGAAVVLGIIATPLAALLPTIQLGTGEDGACAGLLQQAQTAPRVAVPPATPVRPRPRH